MDRKDEAAKLGRLWAQAYHDRPLDNSPSSSEGIDPATITLLIQLATVIIPLLMKRCDMQSRDVQFAAKKGFDGFQRRHIRRALVNELGWVEYIRLGGKKLRESAEMVLARDEALPMVATLVS